MQPYYQHGNITIYHGDCRDVLPRLTEPAALLWTDSAYNLEEGGMKDGFGGYLEAMRHNENNQMFETLLWDEWVPLAYNALRADADAVLMTNDKNLRGCLNAMYQVGLGLHNVFLWSKHNQTPNKWGMKSIEFMCYGWRGRARKLNDCSMGQVFHDRNPIGNKKHPTHKPASLIYKHIVNMTDLGDLVLDPFGGSMSTMVAAKRAGRRGIAIEIDEAMCEAGALWLETIHADEQLEQSVFA